MAIDPGTRPARFLPQGKRYSSIARYTVRQGVYLHTCGKSFDKLYAYLGKARRRRPLWSK